MRTNSLWISGVLDAFYSGSKCHLTTTSFSYQYAERLRFFSLKRKAKKINDTATSIRNEQNDDPVVLGNFLWHLEIRDYFRECTAVSGEGKEDL